MLPPKVTVTIPQVRERRYVRPGEGGPSAPPPAGPPAEQIRPSTATSRQRIYVGKPGTEPPPPAAPAPAPAAPVTPALAGIRPVPTIPPLGSAAAAPSRALPSVAAAPAPALPAVPLEIPVSAYSSEEARVLGTPRGLIAFAALEGLKPALAASPATPTEPEEDEAEEASEAAPMVAAAAAPDPMLDEVIEGLRTRIQELKSARRGPASAPGEIAAPPTHSTVGLTRAPRPSRSLGTLLAATFLVVFVAAGFGLGGAQVRRLFGADESPTPAKPPERRPEVTAPVTVNWQETDLARLDSILSAERARSREEMGRLIGHLQAERPGLPGLETLVVRQAMLSGNRLAAETEVRLVRLLKEANPKHHASLAELHYLRARSFGGQRRLETARTSLSEAMAADPSRPELYFERAEVNRRMGRVREALADYDRALSRTRPGWQPARLQVEFRRRLALIELGRAEEIGSERYLAELAKPQPAGEWLLTAAAVSLFREEHADGARWMQRARAQMPLDAYLASIEDYFFRNQASRLELKDVFPSAADRAAFLQRAMPFLADP